MSALLTSPATDSTKVLPSGRAITVHRFVEEFAFDTRDLHVCPCCTAENVEPSNWVEMDQNNWQMELNCPECGWSETDVYTAEEVEALEAHMDARSA